MSLDFPPGTLEAPKDPTRLPVVCVCGTGGSGTRIFGQILLRAGVFLGNNRNAAEDSLDLVAAIDALALDGEQALRGDPSAQPSRQALDLWHAALREHLSGHDGHAPWGWKNPRSMYLAPLSAQLLPGLRLIHVVRDGRDMALSENRRQYLLHRPGGPDSPVARARFWSDTNLDLARFGEARLGRRYARVRYEDLARDPAGLADRLFAQLDLPRLIGLCRDLPPGAPRPPRHRDLPPDHLAQVQAAALPGLGAFGYV